MENLHKTWAAACHNPMCLFALQHNNIVKLNADEFTDGVDLCTNIQSLKMLRLCVRLYVKLMIGLHKH